VENSPLCVAAVDLGASSGRVLLAVLRDGRIELRQVSRFANGGREVAGIFSWDLPHLVDEVERGLAAAAREARGLGLELSSVGVDSWAVDYGLLDATGQLLRLPAHHRDPRTAASYAATTALIDPWEIYQRSGIALLSFNTVFQLVADGEFAHSAARALLIPDLVNYFLCGVEAWERTNASTTQLLDLGREWDDELFRRLGLARHLVGDLVEPATVLGPVTSRAALDAGVSANTQVITVASHDTASAVVAVPAQGRNFAYISSGTWSLVGVELDDPLIDHDAFAAGYTNELGAFGRTRFLRNITGFWLLQEVIREYALEGEDYDAAQLSTEAARLPAGRFLVDAESAELLGPGDMRGRLAAACRRLGGPAPEAATEFARCIMDSLALAYRRAIRGISTLSGVRVDAVHVVGGGALNEVLCQLTADACGVVVIAGPVEAAALGNALVQFSALGALDGDLTALRAVAAASFPTATYQPVAANETSWADFERRLFAPRDETATA